MDESEIKIPTIKIDTAEGIVRTIRNRFDGEISSESENDLAQALDHKNSDSGAFRSKLADLRKYGLIDGWGNKFLTERGRNLIDDKESVAREIIEENPLFKRAHNRFNTSFPEKEEWTEFLGDHDINLADDLVSQSRKSYRSLIKQLPEENTEPFSEEYFDKYYENLDNEDKRKLCLQSLKGLVDRPLPSIEYFDKISTQIEEVNSSEDIAPLIDILKRMCYSSPNMIQEERLDTALDLAMEFLDENQPENVRWNAIQIFEALDPSHSKQRYTDDIWTKTMTLAEAGIEQGDKELQDHARRLFKSLVKEWADERLLQQIEVETFDAYTEGDDFEKFAESWHQTCREQLELT